MTLEHVDRYDPNAVGDVGDRAVVLGGSVAGLCAARVLADAFEEVIVLERDRLPDEPVAHDGAPQTSHPHALLEAGRATLEDFFPGFCESILVEGGLVIDASRDMRYYDRGTTLAGGPHPLPMYCASRALFEQAIRRRVRDLASVHVRDGCRFVDYWTDGGRVTGVTVRDGNGESTLDADLVVDATGRTSRTPAWLADLGFPRPPVEEVTVDVTYSTVRVERDPDSRFSVVVPPTPDRTRGAAAIPVEGERWEVILQGIHGDDAPTDREGYVAFAESLPARELHDLVHEKRWVTDEIDHYPFPSSIRRRYDRLDRFPEGLLVTGDAIASFNPVYGQGMSVAALDALALHHSLRDGLDSTLATRFFERTAPIVDAVWNVAVGADFEFPQTSGPKPRGTDLFNRYVSRLRRRSHADGALTDAYFRVFRLEKPPESLLHPRIVWRVLGPRAVRE